MRSPHVMFGFSFYPRRTPPCRCGNFSTQYVLRVASQKVLGDSCFSQSEFWRRRWRLLLLLLLLLLQLLFQRVRTKLTRKITSLISTELRTSEATEAEVQSRLETDMAPPNNYCTQQPTILKEHTTVKSKVYMKLTYAIKEQWHTGPVTRVPTVIYQTDRTSSPGVLSSPFTALCCCSRLCVVYIQLVYDLCVEF